MSELWNVIFGTSSITDFEVYAPVLPNGRTKFVEITPTTNRTYGDMEIQNLLYETVLEAAQGTKPLWTLAQVEARVTGILSIRNITTGDAQLSTDQAIQLGALRTANNLLATLLSIVQKSNTAIHQNQLIFGYIIDQNSWVDGSGDPTPPVWLPKLSKLFQDTWKEHSIFSTPINCMAFAIATKMPGSKRHVKQRAYSLMVKFGWINKPAHHSELAKFIKEYPKYRVTIIIPSMQDQRSTTYTGAEFEISLNEHSKQPKDSQYIIYLVWDGVNHYGLISFPTLMLKQTRGFSHGSWCHLCVSSYSPVKGCNCANPQFSYREIIKTPKPCEYCGMIKCLKGCYTNCNTCGARFVRGYNRKKGEGHRCIVYQEPFEQVFTSEPSVEQKGSNYMLWAYDFEAAIKRIPGKYTTKFVTENNQFIYKDGVLDTVEIVAGKQVVNLVVVNIANFRLEMFLIANNSLPFLESMVLNNSLK